MARDESSTTGQMEGRRETRPGKDGAAPAWSPTSVSSVNSEMPASAKCASKPRGEERNLLWRIEANSDRATRTREIDERSAGPLRIVDESSLLDGELSQGEE